MIIVQEILEALYEEKNKAIKLRDQHQKTFLDLKDNGSHGNARDEGMEKAKWARDERSQHIAAMQHCIDRIWKTLRDRYEG